VIGTIDLDYTPNADRQIEALSRLRDRSVAARVRFRSGMRSRKMKRAVEGVTASAASLAFW
jgi:hypothetical protein